MAETPNISVVVRERYPEVVVVVSDVLQSPAGATSWNVVRDKPATFPSTIPEVEGLEAALAAAGDSSALATAVGSLETAIGGRATSQALATEQSEREAADIALALTVTGKASQAVLDTVSRSLATEADERTAAVVAETNARIAAMATEMDARTAAIAAEAGSRVVGDDAQAAALDTEAQNRAAGDAVLSSAIQTLADLDATKQALDTKADQSALTAEILARQAAIDAKFPQGKLDASLLPALALHDTLFPASQAEMQALTAQRGDMAVRTDTGERFWLTADDPMVLTNWVSLGHGSDGVTSVAGKVGAVTLAASDVGAYSATETNALLSPLATTAALNDEAAARAQGNASLNTALGQEQAARVAADAAHDTAISNEVIARQAADTAEQTARTDAVNQIYSGFSTALAGKASTSHHATHAAGGSDAITPADIGAVSAGDARLTDARTPTAHRASHATGGSDAITPADIGAVVYNDTRLADARTPTNHHSTHATGGSDALTPSDIGALATAGGTLTNLRETLAAPAIGATNVLTLDFSTGSVFRISVNKNITSVVFTNLPASGTAFMLTLIFDITGAFTITWPTAIKWPAATSPTLSTTSGQVQIMTLLSTNGGTTFYGAAQDTYQ
jgi:hypothetical protein